MKKIVVSIIFIVTFLMVNNTYAAIEMKSTSNNNRYTNVTVSESFNLCYDLRNNTSTLGENTLDPHMCKNTEWGAVLYLAHSRYGANNVNIQYNTTGNNTGIMNMDGYVQMADLRSTRAITSTTTGNYAVLNEALADSNKKRYVEITPDEPTVENTLGMAFKETEQWYGANNGFPNNNYPVSIRASAFGFNFSYVFGTGQAHPNVTFRPVIWN